MVQCLRETLLAQEAADPVSLASYDGHSLPYIDNLVNLIIAPKTTAVSKEEMVRVLVPLGRAIIGDEVVVKPWPAEFDVWSHFLHDASNNAVSNDKVVGPPKNMQWVGTTLWARKHDTLASMSAIASTRGRIYYIMDNGPIFAPAFEPRWYLQAIDASNGLPLWKRPMKSWVDHMRHFRSGPVQIARLLVAHDDTVYTTQGLNEPVVAIDGKTGKTLKTYDNTEKVEEILYHQGNLIVVVSKGDVEHANIPNTDYRAKAVKLIDARSGNELWRWPRSGFADIVPDTLAASGQQVFLQCEGDTVCVGLQSGEEQWRTTTLKDAERLVTKPGNPKNDKQAKSIALRRSGWTFNTLVVAQDVVLSSDHQTLVALSARDGTRLWDATIRPNFNQTPAEDILVIDGLVWTSPNLTEGRDLKTGRIVKTLDLQETMVTTGHHHRCYRDRGVGSSIIFGHRGMDFFDTEGDSHSRNNWVRGVCQWGVMPANGLMYAPPHDCGCYPEAILHGFWALAPEQRTLHIPADFNGHLEKGPAYGRPTNGTSDKSDWPTYRQNAARGGVSRTSLPSTLHEVWSVPVGESLTPPVVAGNTVLLACKKNKAVYALDAATGRTRWHYVAGGVVDSPPTVVDQRVLFGAADGTVTCLSLDDGELMWRFNAAPSPMKAMAMGELESLWPASGNVLVKNDIAYFTAGRSSYLDGGLFLFGLSTKTGEVIYYHRYHIVPPSRIANTENVTPIKNGPNIADFKTFESADKSDAFSMVGNVNDVMVADEDSVYLRHMRFNDRLEPQTDFRHHLFSTSTLLDPNEAYRSHWIYGNGDFSLVPVSYEWLTRIKQNGQQSFYTFAGSICVHDGATLWGEVRDGPNGRLVAFDIHDIDQPNAKDFGDGRRDIIDMGYIWTASLPFHTRTMVKAGPTLYLAGGDSIEQLLGEVSGGVLQSFAAADGRQDGSVIPLRAPPVFDGMAVGDHALFISLIDGSLVCLK
jgi:outer membrane protein assembly factor BamB